MSQSAASSEPAGNLAPSAPDTRLHGRWLLVARVGWIALTLLVLTLSAMAIPRADALLQAACQPGALCVSGITPADLRQLQQHGPSPAFLAAYQIGGDVGTVLIYTALAALIFWRRSADRMALFCAYILVLFGGATYTGLFDIGLRTLSPVWYGLVGGLELLAQVSVPTFFLLFPSGRFVPRWTRWYVLLGAIYEVWYVFVNAGLSQSSAGSLVFAVLLLSLVGFQVYRYRRVSTFQERQQTKWVVFGLALALGGLALFTISATLFLPPELLNSPVAAALLPSTVGYGLLLFIPISIAIAILRSHLYDIDTLINKVLVYGLLTGILGAIYASLIIGLESLAGLIIGPSVQRPVVLVISTLAIFVLFQPVRTRLQSIIDRRFYRHKYDAEKTLAAFSATLRQEVDLAQLREQLIAVVQETMQPAQASLWLRQPEQHPIEQVYRLEPHSQLPTKPTPD
ncbi:MAG: hypothetical protein ACLQUY_28425 [Ktedonobacterales bacterium]